MWMELLIVYLRTARTVKDQLIGHFFSQFIFRFLANGDFPQTVDIFLATVARLSELELTIPLNMQCIDV